MPFSFVNMISRVRKLRGKDPWTNCLLCKPEDWGSYSTPHRNRVDVTS